MRLLRFTILAAPAAAATALTAGARASTGPSLQPLCTVGPIRCQVALRTDIPVVSDPTGLEDYLGAPELRAAYKLASAAATRGGNQTVALVDAYDAPNIEHDLNVYRAQYGLGPCTTAASGR
jgi:hypothetical protein